MAWGPADAGLVPFTIDRVPYALDIPQDGRLVAEWAADGNWMALVPGALAAPHRDEFYDRLAAPDDKLTLRACWRLAHHLAPEVYGVEWWAAGRLCATAREGWISFSSWAVTVGFDPAKEPAHRLCAAALSWVMRTAKDEKEGRSLERKIFDPPRPVVRRGVKTAKGFSPEEQDAAFRAAMASLGEG